MTQFSEGDIVQLKSGGPKMTCTGTFDHVQGFRCKWFAGSKLEEGWFQPGMLKPAEAEKSAKGK